jgi:hypothetical protein
MGAAGGPDGDDADAAAARYADELSAAAPADHDVPPFDVLLLGLGGRGTPRRSSRSRPAAHDERLVVGVHGCPEAAADAHLDGLRRAERRPRGLVRRGRAGKAARSPWRSGAPAGAGPRRGRHRDAGPRLAARRARCRRAAPDLRRR